jgi:DNA polymerase-3 subunit beta
MTDLAFQTTAGAMCEAVRTASLAVDRKSPLPILLMLRIEAAGTSIKVNGSNLSCNASARFDALSVTTPGAVAVDQQRLLDVLSRLPGDKKLTCKLKGQKLGVTCGSSRYEMSALPAADFPTPPKPAAENLELPSELLGELLSTVQHAALEDDQRAHLSGVALRWGKGAISSVATDSARLALLTRPFDGAGAGHVFVPHRAVGVLRKFCETLGRGSRVHLAAGEYLHAWGGDSGISCKLLEEIKLPDYDRVAKLGDGATSGFIADRQKLVDALERLRVAAAKDAQSGAVRIYCDKEAGRVDLTSDGSECSGREAAKAEVSGDGETRVGAAQLIDALKAFGAEKARVRFSAEAPVVIEPAVEQPAFLGLVMPMRAQ